MKANCKQAVQAVAQRLGRKPLTEAQFSAIDEKISSTMKFLAQTEEGWSGMSADERVSMAAETAMEQIAAAAQKKIADAQLQIVKTAATEQRIADSRRLAPDDARSHALVSDLDKTGDYIHGVKAEAMGNLMGLMDAVKSGEGAGFGRRVSMFLFDAENPQMTKDLAAEVFGNADGKTGNKVAQEGAKAWLKTIEDLRTRFNKAGGDVGKLDYGYLPQPHDQARVLEAGKEAWTAKMLPLLDRGRYVTESGARMSDAEVTQLLHGAWETIATDGMNKSEPGQFKGTGARANRGSESRVLHFKDAPSFQSYLQDFGRGSMYDAMVAHIGRLARDIGLVERYGPNPNSQMRLQFDLAARADARKVDDLPRTFGLRPQSYWDAINGTTASPASAKIAQIGTDLRNIQTFGKLGGAVISSITDLGTYMVTTRFNKLSYWDSLANIKTSASKDGKRFATSHGIIADSMMGDLNRWTSDNIKQTWSGRIANSTMKLSLMNAWTDTLRRAFSLTMMQGLAKLSKTEWGKLSEWDRTHMERKGITEADWEVITRAELTDFQGIEHLTPEAIRAADIETARPADLQRIRDDVATQTTELSERNAQDQAWIRGRLDKFDAARDALNRQVKASHAERLDKNAEATGSMLERMSLLDAQRESAKLQSDMEADFNRFRTQDDVRSFLNAVEDGRSADLADVQSAKPAVRGGLESAEAVGRRYGEQKGRLERSMQEIQSKIGEMDRKAGRETDADAKAAQQKADAMGDDLREFVERSQARQLRRQAVIERLQRAEAPRVAAEAERIKDEVVTKVLGLIQDESEYAVLNPDLATKIYASGGLQRGTVKGELARSVMQFKSFPIAMVSRHWRRMLDAPRVADGSAPALANRTLYMGALMVTTTALGAIALQAKQITQGKDPIDMTGPHATKFWLKAVAQGGGLSIVGDTLLNDPASSPGDVVANATKTLAGPALGTIGEATLKVGAANVWEAAKGKPTHAAAETLNLLRANTPYVGLWYAKAAVDHAGMHALQENLSSGYLSKMKARAKKEFGQDYWWQPGTGAPERAPDIGKAVGG